MALLLYLITRPDAADRPRMFTAVDINTERLNHMQSMAANYNTDITVKYVQSTSAGQNDTIVAALPPHSLVVNATGMGKDTPGSPITDAATFPQDGIAWEFNYRGERNFMQQALQQAHARNLRVEDGWVYFVHGWSQVIFDVLDMEMTPEWFRKLDAAASTVR
ncbi:MAG: hypothetical protein AAF653_03100 [Chloroflexota bacterium]